MIQVSLEWAAVTFGRKVSMEAWAVQAAVSWRREGTKKQTGRDIWSWRVYCVAGWGTSNETDQDLKQEATGRT